MLNRKTLAAAALVATGFTAPTFADDGDVRHAQNLLEQARTYGHSGITGQAAGQVDEKRDERAHSESRSTDEQRWREIARSQSLN